MCMIAMETLFRLLQFYQFYLNPSVNLELKTLGSNIISHYWDSLLIVLIVDMSVLKPLGMGRGHDTHQDPTTVIQSLRPQSCLFYALK